MLRVFVLDCLREDKPGADNVGTLQYEHQTIEILLCSPRKQHKPSLRSIFEIHLSSMKFPPKAKRSVKKSTFCPNRLVKSK
jgi:hypothetical protein